MISGMFEKNRHGLSAKKCGQGQTHAQHDSLQDERLEKAASRNGSRQLQWDPGKYGHRFGGLSL